MRAGTTAIIGNMRPRSAGCSHQEGGTHTRQLHPVASYDPIAQSWTSLPGAPRNTSCAAVGGGGSE